jgi:hypothetical protein
VPPFPVPPLAVPLLDAVLPMLEIELPETVPFSVLIALAVEVLNAFETLEVADPPLLAAAAPSAVALALPLELFWLALLSLFWSD